VRRLNARVYLLVRTRYITEIAPLIALGADEVIPEEFETSVEIFSRILGKYLLPKEEIEKLISEVRTDGYQMFRSLSKEATACDDLRLCLPDVEISSFRIAKYSSMVGRTLLDTEMRKKHGVTLLAVKREMEIISNPPADVVFQENDVLFVVGHPEKINRIKRLFSANSGA